MKKLNTIDAFVAFQNNLIASWNDHLPTIIIPAGSCAIARGANDIIRTAKNEILKNNLTDKIHLRITGCHGYCSMEPSILVEPFRYFYPKINASHIPKIISAAIDERPVKSLLCVDEISDTRISHQDDIPFFKFQTRTILSQHEQIDPMRIPDYIRNDGYSSCVRVLSHYDPKWVIHEIKTSHFCGRGGGGFPTGMKWELLSQQSSKRGKYIICNGDEGDPGAFMDRSLLEGNPHSIIEGMLLGAFATGATDGIIYTRLEYSLAIKHVKVALLQAHEYGLLGKNILNTGFSFDIKIITGAGAFVCGEETALIKAIEGKSAEPRQRPPFPVEKGIGGRPTLINNVETWASIPIIIRKGSEQFAKTGIEENAGTKIISLNGRVKNIGLVEVPMGTILNDVVNVIGGGASNGSTIKAVQIAGPSGGCIPTNLFDTQIDYNSLTRVGSYMGLGSVTVIDQKTCMVDLAKYFVRFMRDESCGKCFTCRKGTQRLAELLEDITNGNASPSHLDLLEELSHVVKDTSMCGLGQMAPNPILSTLRHFKHEYHNHIWNKKCDAYKCKELIGAPCQSACPIGTEAWRYIAYIAQGEFEEAYQVIRESNPFPSVCARVCTHPCEVHCRSGASENKSIAIRALKRFITDRIDPSTYIAPRKNKDEIINIAVIGSGPAGLTAAHYLSLSGYTITIFEAENYLGGMLLSGIPEYRLPNKLLQKEINNLIDQSISLKYNTALGRDITIDGLFENDFTAVFLAMGAHKSRHLNIEGEDFEGVFPALHFLKAFNINGVSLAHGRVFVIGGGDSALDAARVASRQTGVESVTILYRRTKDEMPGLPEEIDAAQKEGIIIQELVTPLKIHSKDGIVTGLSCLKNSLSEIDVDGRRKAIAVPGSEFIISLETLIITIGDVPDIEYISDMGIEINETGTIHINQDTLQTSRVGVFAGGDVASESHSIVHSIATGKKAATMIDRFIRGEELHQPLPKCVPTVYIEPTTFDESALRKMNRVISQSTEIRLRKQTFSEVEQTLSSDDAIHEARRCLRCDLEFTTKEFEEPMFLNEGTADV